MREENLRSHWEDLFVFQDQSSHFAQRLMHTKIRVIWDLVSFFESFRDLAWNPQFLSMSNAVTAELAIAVTQNEV